MPMFAFTTRSLWAREPDPLTPEQQARRETTSLAAFMSMMVISDEDPHEAELEAEWEATRRWEIDSEGEEMAMVAARAAALEREQDEGEMVEMLAAVAAWNVGEEEMAAPAAVHFVEDEEMKKKKKKKKSKKNRSKGKKRKRKNKKNKKKRRKAVLRFHRL